MLRLIFNSSSLNVDEKVSINPFNDVLLKEDCLEKSLRILEI